MKITLPYLIERHEYWKQRIHSAGIWEKERFSPVEIKIGKVCRTYNAVFRRKRKKGKGGFTDNIVIYNNVDEFEECFLDSILVHEMIHQYICQTGMKDSRAHGPLFRNFMSLINEAFPTELKIKISDTNPSLPKSGHGDVKFELLHFCFNDGNEFLSVIMPGHIDYFLRMLKRHKKTWGVKKVNRAWSDDVYFSRFRKCVKVLHGLKKPASEMRMIINQHNVIYGEV